MIPLIIVGATLAIVGYAEKEYCNDKGCPWDNHSSTSEKDKESEDMKSSKKSKEFHKYKKNLEDDILSKLNSYADSISKLSHLKLFDKWQNLNQAEILSILVIAMDLATQKETIYVNLSVS